MRLSVDRFLYPMSISVHQKRFESPVPRLNTDMENGIVIVRDTSPRYFIANIHDSPSGTRLSARRRYSKVTPFNVAVEPICFHCCKTPGSGNAIANACLKKRKFDVMATMIPSDVCSRSPGMAGVCPEWCW